MLVLISSLTILFSLNRKETVILCLYAGFLNDLYRLDTSTLVWNQVEVCSGAIDNLPEPSKGHGLTSSGENLYVFGGYGPSGCVVLSHVNPLAADSAPR